ncbi:hypothetical protein TURU_158714 [Turdus rufiventris]|nr:hypothetical protein TURU_158714 [Turdus rufiventris]
MAGHSEPRIPVDSQERALRGQGRARLLAPGERRAAAPGRDRDKDQDREPGHGHGTRTPDTDTGHRHGLGPGTRTWTRHTEHIGGHSTLWPVLPELGEEQEEATPTTP